MAYSIQLAVPLLKVIDCTIDYTLLSYKGDNMTGILTADPIMTEGRKDAARAIIDDSHQTMWRDYCPYTNDKDKRDLWRQGWNSQWYQEED